MKNPFLKLFGKGTTVSETTPAVKVYDMSDNKKVAQEIRTLIDKSLLSNNVYNRTSDGRVLDGTLRPLTEEYPNGDSYTVEVYHPEDRRLNGRGVIIQIDINLNGKEQALHFVDCPYGGDTFMTAEELACFKTALVGKALNISRYG
jgi:hypothetical protein